MDLSGFHVKDFKPDLAKLQSEAYLDKLVSHPMNLLTCKNPKQSTPICICRWKIGHFHGQFDLLGQKSQIRISINN